jgi:hypothetical protein
MTVLAETPVTGVSGNPVVVGTFRSRDTTSADRWLLVANRSHHARAQAVVTPNQQTVGSVGVFQPASQTYSGRPVGPVPFDLAPGAATLVKLVAK